MAVVLTGLLLILSASAQPVCTDPVITDEECFSVPMGVTGLTYNGQIHKFDSSLGTLLSVKMTTRACAALTYQIDSEDPVEQTWNVISQGGVVLTPPIGPQITVFAGTPDDGIDVFTGPDDEVGFADFAGPDYGMIVQGTVDNPVCEEDESFFDTPGDLALFSGIAGETLPVQIRTASNKAVINENSSNYEEKALVQASGEVCVEYTYCPRACIYGSKVGCDDEPLSGWTITLTKPDGTTVTDVTDDDGQYSFCNLPTGIYDVCEETRPGWYPVGPSCYNDIIMGGDDVYVNAFKNTEHFCISGYKYNVTNDAEDPLEGWKITLTKPDGSTVTDTTDANGYYEFCDLANGQYKVSEELKTGWVAKSPTSVTVELYCEDESVDFRNALQPTLVCVCPFILKSELYTASCKEVKVVDASKGILANDQPSAVVLNPKSITIDPKYGTIEVHEDGSFVYDPTVATGRLYSGIYVTFKYSANNGLCDSKYPATAKIQVRC